MQTVRMRTGAEIATLASLIADPARARMLTALMGGMALTATELALEAGVAPSTASSHLAKLTDAHLLAIERQGRHRYYRLFDADIAEMLEGLMNVVAARQKRERGTTDPALREARVCYDHLAGERGVWLFDQLQERDVLTRGETVALASGGSAYLRAFGVDPDVLRTARRPLCRTCLDWTERRHHLAGALGAAILQRVFDLRWARRELHSRAVVFTPAGERAFRDQFAAS